MNHVRDELFLRVELEEQKQIEWRTKNTVGGENMAQSIILDWQNTHNSP